MQGQTCIPQLGNFGREDQLDRAPIERLAGSLCRLLAPDRAVPDLAYQGSVAHGGPWLLVSLFLRCRRLQVHRAATRRLASQLVTFP